MKTDNMKLKHGVYIIKMEINYSQLNVSPYKVYFLCLVDRASRYIFVTKTSLFRQSASTCFGHICSPSSGGIFYIYNTYHLLYI